MAASIGDGPAFFFYDFNVSDRIDDAFYDAAPGRVDPDFFDETLADGAPFYSDRFPLVRGVPAK